MVTVFVTVFICISSKPLIKPGSCLCCPSSRDHGNAGRTISLSGRGHGRAGDQPAGPAAHSAGHTSPSRDKGTRLERKKPCVAYRKEGAEENLTSPAAGREDKDGKSDCFQLTSRQSMGKRLLDPCVV